MMRDMISGIIRIIKALLTRRITFQVDLIPLDFKGLPLKKIVNWALTESSVFFKPCIPWGMPTILQVEPTSRCNLSCTICPVTTGLGRASGDMDPAVFKKVISELKDYLLLILFWDWGEPFLSRHAYRMIRYAHDRGIKVMASTNGHTFASEESARKLVESGLDIIIFSIDGINQKTYARYRRNGSLETALDGIRNIVKAKKLLKSDLPIVNLRFIVMKHNENEIPMLKDFADPLGVDILSLRKFYAIPNQFGDADILADSLKPTLNKYALPCHPAEKIHLEVSKNPCRNLWNCPTIHWDGTVCSCYSDYSESNPLGKLVSQNFKEIWCGNALRNLRKRFRENWKSIPLCNACSYGLKGGNVGRYSTTGAIVMNHGADLKRSSR